MNQSLITDIGGDNEGNKNDSNRDNRDNECLTMSGGELECGWSDAPKAPPPPPPTPLPSCKILLDGTKVCLT